MRSFFKWLLILGLAMGLLALMLLFVCAFKVSDYWLANIWI